MANIDKIDFTPIDENTSKIDFTPVEESAPVQNVPRETSNTPQQPNYLAQRARAAMEAFQQNPMMPIASPAMVPYYKSIGTGVGEAAQNLANLPIKAMGGKPIQAFDTSKAYDPQVAKFAQEVAPMAIPFAGEETLVGKAASLVPKAVTGAAEGIAKGAARLTARSIPRSLYGGAFGAASEAAENKDATPESMFHAAQVGAALNTIIPGALDAIPGAYKGLVNQYNIAAKDGKISTPEQAVELHKALKDDVLSFPDLIKAPKLQSFYHGILKYVPFSGVAKQQAEAVGRLEQDAANIHTNILGEVNEADPVAARQSIANDIASDVNKKYPITELPELNETKGLEEVNPMESREGIVSDIQKHVDNKSKLLSPAFDEINKVKLYFNNSGTKEYVNNLLEKHKSSLESGMGGSLLPTVKTDLEKISKGEKEDPYEIVSQFPAKYQEQMRKQLPEKELPETTIGTVRDSISKYQDKASGLIDSGNIKTARIYSQLADKLKNDLDSSLKESANPNSYEQYKMLNKLYEEHIVPFKHSEKPGMRKIINNKINYSSDSELENILKDTTNEDAIAQLPQETKNKIFSRFLNSNINPKISNQTERVVDAYSKLTPYEKGLLDTQSKNTLENVSSTIGKTKERLESQNKVFDKSPGIKKITSGDFDLNSPELEGILKDSRSQPFIKTLPLNTQKKIFGRLLHENIGKTEEKLGTRSEKLVAAYNKMSSYEKGMLDSESKKALDNLSARVEQLKPALKSTKSNIWRHIHRARYAGYMLGGAAATALHSTTPIAAAIAPAAGFAKMLRDPRLMEAYKTGVLPMSNKVQDIARTASKASILAGER
jgi:hypothetical protein